MKTIIYFAVILIFTSPLNAQSKHIFLDKENNDTIKNYRLLFYEEDSIKYEYPNKKGSVLISEPTLVKADSIIIQYDSWYQERFIKRQFKNKNIELSSHISLKPVILSSKKEKFIGPHRGHLNKLHLLGNNYGKTGFLYALRNKDSYSKIKSISIRIFNYPKKDFEIYPILYLADTINDDNKIYLYPKEKPFEITKSYKNKWLEIPINRKIPFSPKSKIYVGFWIPSNIKIVIGTSEISKNEFLEFYEGNSNIVNPDNVWTDQIKYYTRNKRAKALMIKMEIVE